MHAPRFLTTVEYREQRPMRESSGKLMNRVLRNKLFQCRLVLILAG